MINISDSARDRLLHIMQQEKEEKPFVRVGVESGGCSGLSYKLDFDASKKEDDELSSNIDIRDSILFTFVFCFKLRKNQRVIKRKLYIWLIIFRGVA